MKDIINFGNEVRTTCSTIANDESSRSHAICQIELYNKSKVIGKLTLCDLAGSERAQDTMDNTKDRRIEGAGINKSLLALKECIRAMSTKSSHIPFRTSKLTMVLKDSFTSKEITSKVLMIACVCPGSSSVEHTLNTLRYADRLKRKQNIRTSCHSIIEASAADEGRDSEHNLSEDDKQEEKKPISHRNHSPIPRRTNYVDKLLRKHRSEKRVKKKSKVKRKKDDEDLEQRFAEFFRRSNNLADTNLSDRSNKRLVSTISLVEHPAHSSLEPKEIERGKKGLGSLISSLKKEVSYNSSMLQSPDSNPEPSQISLNKLIVKAHQDILTKHRQILKVNPPLTKVRRPLPVVSYINLQNGEERAPIIAFKRA